MLGQRLRDGWVPSQELNGQSIQPIMSSELRDPCLTKEGGEQYDTTLNNSLIPSQTHTAHKIKNSNPQEAGADGSL